MPYCSRCGQKVADDALFCQRCGASIAPADGTRTGRRETWEGTVHKCPSCGAEVGAFVSTCPVCGHELRGVGANESVREFEERLSSVSSGKKRDAMIRSFYIPNTREDIYEFFILADSNIRAGGENVDAWRAKLEQAHQKAELVFGESPELTRIDKLYKRTSKIKTGKKGTGKSSLSKIGLISAAIFMAFGILIMLVGYMSSESFFSPLSLVGEFALMCGIALLVTTSDNNANSDSKNDDKR